MCGKLRIFVVMLVVFVMVVPSLAFASSYSSRINTYVEQRPQQAAVVRKALVQAGWSNSTLMRQAVMVSAGESGMNPLNDRNKSCSGLFQILNGKRSYGTWSAAELSDKCRLEHYTLRDTVWLFGKVKQYRGGTYIGNKAGWYVIPGRSGNSPQDYRFGTVRTYSGGTCIGAAPGYYQKNVVVYAPRVGEYKIFNPVFNAEIALRMYNSRGWRPWSVARKLGY